MPPAGSSKPSVPNDSPRPTTRISARRAEALAEVEAARTAARQSVDEAVASVAGRAVELAVGKRPDPEVVRRAVADVTSVGAGR